MPAFHASWTIDTATGRADAGGPSPTTHYRVTNHNSGRVMDVVGSSIENNAEVRQYGWNGGMNQRWEFREAGDGYVRIVSQRSGKCLDVAGASTSNGANITQYTCGTGTSQEWTRTAS
jgi:endoglucanase